MVRLSAVAIKIADNPIRCPFKLISDASLESIDADLMPEALSNQSTWVAPGILRRATVAAQLEASVSTNTITALMIAVS
jgi:hypothetical protein